MDSLKEKLQNNEPLNKGDIVRALSHIKRDIEAVKGDLEEDNPKALADLNKVVKRIENTLMEEVMQQSLRGRTLLDVKLIVGKDHIELGQQHKEITDLKKEIETVDEKILGRLKEITHNSGILMGVAKGDRDHTKISSKQSKMLEIVDLDVTLNPQEQKVLRFLIIKKYDLKDDFFIPAYFNEIARNANVKREHIKKELDRLVEKDLLQSKKMKNKVFYSISQRFFPNEAHSVEKSIERMR